MNELVYGIHSVRSVLKNNKTQILCVYFFSKSVDSRVMTLINEIHQHRINIKKCTFQYLSIKVKGALHQGIVAEIVQKICIKESELSKFLVKCKHVPLLLILDGITDPHNLGACIRSADAAGVDLVIAPRNRSARINGVVRKVASGSADRIPFLQVTNLVRTLLLLKKHDIWVIGTVLKSNRYIFKTKLVGPLAFVMGSEGDGIRCLTKKNCDELVSIPMSQSISSLNVSVATGVCLFETLRQREFFYN